MARPGNALKVFVSYSLRDADWVRSFADDLSRRGFAVTTTESLHAGGEWRAQIAGALRESDVVIPILTDGSADRASILFELGVAMAGGKALVPVVSRDVDVRALPEPLRRIAVVPKESPTSTAARVESGLLKAS